MVRTKFLGILCGCAMAIAACSLPPAAQAQTEGGYGGHPRPVARAVRVMPDEAPTIDGNVSDPVWAKADAFDNFYQIQPDNSAAASERTVVRVLYDENYLYVSIYAYDKDSDQIIARRLTRDNGTSSDDFIKINIDPGLTRRDAYDFEIEPLGGRTDALLQNNNGHLTTWDTIWGVKTAIVKDGWTAEVAIPFRELSFDPAKGDWGFDIVRGIKRKGEVVRWGPAPANTNLNDVSWAGTLTGFTGLSQGLGLDVWVYGLVGYKRYYTGTQTDEPTTRAGGNAYYKITPSLTGTLTFNTDFSDAPLDARQVNTTRFSLFTDETRQFFLQDAASFEFGGRNFINTDNPGSNNGRPFFSRNIGLVNGIPVRLIGGAKLSGAIGDVNVGALAVRTGSGAGAQGQTLSVLRLSKPILAESRIGLIATNGDPSGLSRNTLVGGDFQYQNSTVLGRNRLIADFAFQRSFSSTKSDDDAITAGIVYPNEPFGGQIFYKQLGDNFAPVLGFANRRGIRDVHGGVVYRKRYANQYLRFWEVQADDQHIMDLNNHLESRQDSIQGTLHDRDDDQGSLELVESYEDEPTAFTVSGKVPVPAGQYTWDNAVVNLNTSGARSWNAGVSVECCSFYDGRYLKTTLSFDWRPTPQLSLSFDHSITMIRLTAGDLDIHIFSMEPIYNFTPDMQLRAQLQYDNISKRFSMLARYLWEYEPGQTLFASVGEESVIDDRLHHVAYTGRSTQALIRLGHTFQF